jgi:hypothetical protein
MTINIADNTPRVSYSVAQGVTQTSFAVTFEFFDDEDLNVYVDGTQKTLTTDYTVTGGSGSTGSITISVTGASGGSTVVITRSIELERTTDFPASGAFQIDSLNTELDRFTAISADLNDEISRSLRLTDYDTAVSLVLPDVNSRKGTVLAFDSSTGAVVAGPTTSGVNTLASIATDVATLADIEDGTVATDAISDTAAIASDVTTVAGISSNVTTVAGISSDITTTVANITAIQNASANATAAAASAAAAAASAEDFTDRYYGAHVDDSAAQTFITGQGLTVDTGDVYFNTTSNIIRVYNGSSWDDAFVSSAGFLQAANNLSDVNNAATALTNLGLTATAAEINYNDITTLGTVEASKTVTADGSGEITVPDDKKIIFGTDSDASIKYDETTSDRLLVEGAQVEFAKSVLGSTNTDTTNTGNVTLDFAANQNHVLTLTGNVTLANPTTEQVGQSGFIVFIQDATGGRTVSLGTDYETAGGAGITLSTAASTTDVVPYIVAASGRILLGTPQLAFA